MTQQNPLNLTTTSSSGDAAGEDLSLRGLLTATWHGRWILLVSLGVAGFLGYREVQETGTIWRAEAGLYVQGQSQDSLLTEGLMGSGGRNFVNTQASVIRSVSLLQEVATRPSVAASPLLAQEPNKVGWLRRNLAVRVGRSDDLISVSLDAENVEEACVIVNAIVEEYRRYLGKRGENTVQEKLEVFTRRRDRLIESLETRQEERDAFLEKNSMVSADPKRIGENAIARLDRMRSSLEAAEIVLAEAKKRRAEAGALDGDPELLVQLVGAVSQRMAGAAPLEHPELTGLRSEIAANDERLDSLRDRRTDLAEALTPEHPQIQELDGSIAELEEELSAASTRLGQLEAESFEEVARLDKEQVERVLAYFQTQLDSASAQVDAARAQVEAQEGAARQAGALQAEYNRLITRVEQSSLQVQDLSDSISELNLAEIGKEQLTELKVDVLNPASPETASIASSASKTLAKYLILGLLGGAALTWLRTMLDQRLRTEADLARAAPSPLIGVMPRARLREEVDAISAWDQHKAMAEAARGLRTAVFFGLPEDRGRVIHVTSPQKGDGKSTISAHLSIAMAHAGQRVLVIDADLRSPRQHKLFHVPNESGLSSVLSEEISFEEALVETEIEGLHVLTTGPPPGTPAEMLNSWHFEELLVAQSRNYDRIIVDSPPTLLVTDSCVVATKCDATILVARVSRSTRDATAAAHERLVSVGAFVLGAVLNAMPSGFGYGYGYGYGYGAFGDHTDVAHDSRRRRKAGGGALRASVRRRADLGPFDTELAAADEVTGHEPTNGVAAGAPEPPDSPPATRARRRDPKRVQAKPSR